MNEVEVLRVDGHALQDRRYSVDDDESNVVAGKISISLRNQFSNSLHTFGKLMHLLERLQALERGIAEANTHETAIHAVVVALIAPWSLVFVYRHA